MTEDDDNFELHSRSKGEQGYRYPVHTTSKLRSAIEVIVISYLKSQGHPDDRKAREIAQMVASDAVRKAEHMRQI